MTRRCLVRRNVRIRDAVMRAVGLGACDDGNLCTRAGAND